MSVPHCSTCQCPAPGEFTIYPPHEGFYGRCHFCGQVRWQTEHDTSGNREDRRSNHCGCCTHPHNLPPGGHDARCLADQPDCILID